MTAQRIEGDMKHSEVLLAAAARLEALDASATPGPWLVREDYDDIVLATEDAVDPDGDGLSGSYRCTDRIAGHDFTIYDEDDAEERQVRATFDLIATLRPTAAPLAAHMRAEAHADRYGYPGLIDIARAVLGGAA